MATLGQWKYQIDGDATVLAYAKATSGDAARCGCSGCKNFIAVRFDVFPTEFLHLLESFGVDPAKEGEVYTDGAFGPNQHSYGGWFHFVGTLIESGDFPPIEYSNDFMCYL